jgi:alanyl-tRNA synthetase
VTAFVTTQDEARRMGAMALFGEKYGDRVRVVEVGDYARELCGGTHAARSGQLGMIKLLSEGSIGSGVRRVEGLVGLDAYSWSAREHVLLAQVAAAFKVPADEVPERVAATVARLREVEKELAQLRAGQVLQQAGAFAAGGAGRRRRGRGSASRRRPAPPATWSARWRSTCAGASRRPAGGGLVAAGGERATLVAAVNDAGRARGLSANAVLREAAAAVDGKGGGKDDVAQGGGTSRPASGALARARELVGGVAERLRAARAAALGQRRSTAHARSLRLRARPSPLPRRSPPSCPPAAVRPSDCACLRRQQRSSGLPALAGADKRRSAA